MLRCLKFDSITRYCRLCTLFVLTCSSISWEQCCTPAQKLVYGRTTPTQEKCQSNDLADKHFILLFPSLQGRLVSPCKPCSKHCSNLLLSCKAIDRMVQQPLNKVRLLSLRFRYCKRAQCLKLLPRRVKRSRPRSSCTMLPKLELPVLTWIVVAVSGRSLA